MSEMLTKAGFHQHPDKGTPDRAPGLDIHENGAGVPHGARDPKDFPPQRVGINSMPAKNVFVTDGALHDLYIHAKTRPLTFMALTARATKLRDRRAKTQKAGEG
jgi:hypothetical protein